MQNVLLSSLSSEWTVALSILRTMEVPKSIIAYNSTSSSCEQAQLWTEALAILSLSSQAWQKPDGYTFATISPPANAWRQAWFGYEVASIEALNSAMKCEWQMAIQVFGKVRERSLVPSLVSFNTTSSVCAQALAWSHGFEILLDLDSWRLHPTALTYVQAAHSCVRSQKFLEAVQLLEQTSDLIGSQKLKHEKRSYHLGNFGRVMEKGSSTACFVDICGLATVALSNSATRMTRSYTVTTW